MILRIIAPMVKSIETHFGLINVLVLSLFKSILLEINTAVEARPFLSDYVHGLARDIR
jgi:hypothetical protein